jgi:HD-GYP domain-containing protein (c-di-GMP phosphodiesterase class II)
VSATSGYAAAPDRCDGRLVAAFTVCLRTAQFYEPDNTAAIVAISEVLTELRRGFAEIGAIRIDSRRHSIYVDRERLRASASEYLTVRRLLALFDEWGIGTLTFFPDLTAAEFGEFVYILARSRPHSFEVLDGALRERHITNIEVATPQDETTADAAGAPLHTYSSCIDVYRQLHTAVMEHGQIQTRRLRRVTQAVVDQVLNDEFSMLALTTLKEFDDYLFNHSTNVAILSVALGQHLGLSKTLLGELCLAAFLHDIGKIEVSHDILTKPGPLDEHEWEQMRRHPVNAVHLLLSQQSLGRSTLHAVISGFEHHLNYDMSGYPSVKRKTCMTVFGRIICVADRFDAVTTARSYREHTLTPHEGVHYLMAGSGTDFDPLVVKLFVDTVGLFPPGTLLGLDDGRVGVVRRPPLLGTSADRPLVYVTAGPDKGALVDLADRDDQGHYRYEVRFVYNPANRGLVPAVMPLDLAV